MLLARGRGDTGAALVAGVLVVVVTILVTSTTTSQNSCSWPPVHTSTWSSSPRAEVGRHLLHLGGQLRVTADTVHLWCSVFCSCWCPLPLQPLLVSLDSRTGGLG